MRVVRVLVAIVALPLVLVGSLQATAGADASDTSATTAARSRTASAAAPVSNIAITQTAGTSQGPCLPPVFALSNSVGGNAQTFVLRITASAPLCSPISAKAAIYKMPGNGVAWPQQLVETKNFTISTAGVTEVVFTKTCDPVQFDVLTGATPATISPLGEFHGPLLFPFDLSTSRQWWGSRCPDTSTTTTDPSVGCEDYTPTDLAVDVASAVPGQTITVTGLASPGDTVIIRIASIGGLPVVLGTAVAGPGGLFSASVTIPSNFAEGTYNLTVTSEECPVSGVLSLVVSNAVGQCRDRRTIQAQRGDVINWTLLARLQTSKPLTVTLVPVASGPSVTVYTGAYPASGKVTFTIPNSFANGRYRVVETGTNQAGTTVSSRCGRIRVRGLAGGGGGSTTTSTSTTSSTTTSTAPSTTSTTVPGSTTTTSSTSTSTTSTSTTTTAVPGTTTTTVPNSQCRVVSFEGKIPGLGVLFDDGQKYTDPITLSLKAGTISIPEAVSSDSYAGRASVIAQRSEVWDVEFLAANGDVAGRSTVTGDLADGVESAEWRGSLGSVTLTKNVKTLRVRHRPDAIVDPTGYKGTNSVKPVSIKICGSESDDDRGQVVTSTTTTPRTSTTIVNSEGVLGTTAERQVTLVGSATVTPKKSSSVLGTSAQRVSQSGGTASGLALTGSTVRPFIALGVALMGVGALLVLGARRRRS